MKNLVGKTISDISFADPWDKGLRVEFTDGTTLSVTELRQAGEIWVQVDEISIESDYHKDDPTR